MLTYLTRDFTCFALAVMILGFSTIEAKSTTKVVSENDDSSSVVLPSPNQDFRDEVETKLDEAATTNVRQDSLDQQVAAGRAFEEPPTPVYSASTKRNHEFSYSAPVTPSQPLQATVASIVPKSDDLKAAASYGHHYGHHYGKHHYGGHHGGYHGHHGHGYGPSGWLDMGAWTGGKGSFGWHADYPVGGKHHYGHGRRR